MVDPLGLDDVLRRAKQRDPQALEALVERYSTRVFGLLYRLTGSRDTADDLLQETFLRLVRTIDEYQESGKFEAWLFRIAANLVRDRARRIRRRGVSSPLDAASDGEAVAVTRGLPPGASPEARVVRAEDERKLWAVLSGLSDSEREIIMLRHFSELSFREIAELLQIPLGTALARAHRALGRLRAQFEDEVRS